jgi:rhodanese-related sulfurtransferase/GNAT superfamily N-acetyltransferase
MQIRSLRADDADACDAIVASLPGWFGDPTGLRDCAEAVRSQPGYVSMVDRTPVGFLTFTTPRPSVAEISWMAVHAKHRGSGHGRALLEALVDALHVARARFVVVKTLSDRDPDDGYAQTRAFYLAMGFTPLLDLDIWGPDNPALLLVRTIAAPPGRATTPTVDDLLVAARRGGERLDPRRAADELAAGALLIDQRTLEQRRQHGDIPGATPMSMTVLPWRVDPQSPWRLPRVTDHDTRVIVVCQEGYSSSLSAAWLRDLGMRNVADLEGGFEAWREAGLPVIRLTE